MKKMWPSFVALAVMAMTVLLSVDVVASKATVIDDASPIAALKDKVRDKMVKQYAKDQIEMKEGIKHSADEYGIPYNIAFKEHGKLVIGLDANKAMEFDRSYSTSDVQLDLQTGQDIDVRYYVLDRQAKIKGGGDYTLETSAGTSATITVVKNNKIVTTGHLADVNAMLTAKVGSEKCKEVKIVKKTVTTGDDADAAYGIDMPNRRCDNTYHNDIIHYNGVDYSVTYGTVADVYYPRYIYISGAVSQGNGIIIDSDVTIKDRLGFLNDQAVGSYSAKKGDSGSPIFSITGPSGAVLVGQHVTKACVVDLNNGNNFVQVCSDEETKKGALTIFTPWDQVASSLGI